MGGWVGALAGWWLGGGWVAGLWVMAVAGGAGGGSRAASMAQQECNGSADPVGTAPACMSVCR